MKNMKILVGIIIAVIVIVLILLLLLLPKLQNNEEIKSLDYTDRTNIEQENTYLAQYIVENAIQDYIQYNRNAETEKLSCILEQKQNVEPEQFDEIYYLEINSIYKMERIDDTTYFVYCSIDNVEEYFVVNVDYINSAYSIRKTNKNEFKKAQENDVLDKYKSSIQINNNDYNSIKDEVPSIEAIANKYFYNYIDLLLEKPEIAFSLIEKGYKSQKFSNDIDKYKEYIQNNIAKLSNTAIMESSKETVDNIAKYTIVDIYNRTYIIKEYNYTDYTIELQENTIQDEEYMTLKSKEKVEENIKKVFNFLDDKEYESVYSLLDSEFRNTNFSTLEQFEEYAKETFFDYNVLGNITIQEQGQNYVISVPYKDGNSSIAEKRKMKFVMKLQENTDFIISFEK